MSSVRALFFATLVVGGCVGTNPRWDGPAGETVARDSEATTTESSSDASSDATSVMSGSASGSDASSAEASDSDASSSADESSGGPMMCPMERWPCDGECKDVEKDAHFCSFMCVDCVEWLGEGAKCEHGLCVPKDGGPGPGAVDEN